MRSLIRSAPRRARAGREGRREILPLAGFVAPSLLSLVCGVCATLKARAEEGGTRKGGHPTCPLSSKGDVLRATEGQNEVLRVADIHAIQSLHLRGGLGGGLMDQDAII